MVEAVLRREIAEQVLWPNLVAALARGRLARSTADDRPWSTKAKNIGTLFPHATSGGANEPDKRYYDAMMWTPFGNSLTLDFVKAAIEGENLGNNPAGVTDILAISWTSHDYVNHMFGPESRQSHDQTVRLDRAFEDLFSYIDSRVGRTTS